MTPEQMFVGGVVAVMVLFMAVLGGTAWFNRDKRG